MAAKVEKLKSSESGLATLEKEAEKLRVRAAQAEEAEKQLKDAQATMATLEVSWSALVSCQWYDSQLISSVL